MKTKYILFLFILNHFAAFAQKQDTMMYSPVYSATETFSMRVGRLLEKETISFPPISRFSIQVIRLKDIKSGEQQRGVALFRQESDFKCIIDKEELDDFIENIEKLYIYALKERPLRKLTLWGVTKGGAKYELSNEALKTEEAYARNPWIFKFSCYPFSWEYSVPVELKQLYKIIATLKEAQKLVNK